MVQASSRCVGLPGSTELSPKIVSMHSTVLFSGYCARDRTHIPRAAHAMLHELVQGNGTNSGPKLASALPRQRLFTVNEMQQGLDNIERRSYEASRQSVNSARAWPCMVRRSV